MATEQQDARQEGQRPDTNAASSPSNDPFVQHLMRASTVVRRWPAWKQELLGGTASRLPKSTYAAKNSSDF